jgi:hypothetical protein
LEFWTSGYIIVSPPTRGRQRQESGMDAMERRLRNGDAMAMYDRVDERPAEILTPSVEDLEAMMDDGFSVALDGCTVEPDGTCGHGSKSWLLVLGMI